MNPRNILIPLDGSDLSESALPLALAIARRSNAQVILVRVINPVLTGSGMGLGAPSMITSLQDNEHAVASSYLERQLTHCQGLSVRIVKTVGTARNMLAEVAREEQCDLIVMAAGGRTGVARWFLGSVTESTLRQAHCPVLIVRPSATQPTDGAFHNVLIPSDGSPASTSILPHLEDYLAPTSRVTLLRASGLHPSDYCDIVDPQAMLAFLKDLEDDLRLQTLPGREPAYVVVDGDPAEMILSRAERDKTDLIAMATHGERGFENLFVGGVTEKITRHAPCCVLAFRHTGQE